MTDDLRPMVDTEDAARYVGVVPRTLYGLVKGGRIAAYRHNQGLLFRVADLNAYIESATVKAVDVRGPT
jgi:excisionase family DNA binding protein